MQMLNIAGQQVEYRDRKDLEEKLVKLFAEFEAESDEAGKRALNLKLRAFMVEVYLRTLPGHSNGIGGYRG
jgi:hypothetical protein